MNERSGSYTCYKIVILGDSGSGKTALLTRFADDCFSGKFAPTIGVDFKMKEVDIEGTKMKLQFWDTAGQERFRAVVTSYHRSVHGVLLIYDITNRRSFNNIATWKNVVDEYNAKGDFAVVVIGNKCELTDRRDVTEKEGRDLAADYGAAFYETSAKDNINVNEAFMAIAQSIKYHCQLNLQSRPPPTDHFELLDESKRNSSQKKNNKKSSCCS